MNTLSITRWAIIVAAGSILILAWHAAIDAALIVPPRPDDPAGALTVDETFAAYFEWLRGIAFHDLGVRVLGALTFLALAGLGRAMMGSAGRLLVMAGLFGALGQLIELGGHQAAIAASGSLAPPSTVGLIEFFIDQVAAAVTTAAWATFGAAALTGALATRGRLAAPGAALGGVLLVMAGLRLLDDPIDVADTLLLISGTALIPLWALSLMWPGIGSRLGIHRSAG